jgi:hypothetical protein
VPISTLDSSPSPRQPLQLSSSPGTASTQSHGGSDGVNMPPVFTFLGRDHNEVFFQAILQNPLKDRVKSFRISPDFASFQFHVNGAGTEELLISAENDRGIAEAREFYGNLAFELREQNEYTLVSPPMSSSLPLFSNIRNWKRKFNFIFVCFELMRDSFPMQSKSLTLSYVSGGSGAAHFSGSEAIPTLGAQAESSVATKAALDFSARNLDRIAAADGDKVVLETLSVGEMNDKCKFLMDKVKTLDQSALKWFLMSTRTDERWQQLRIVALQMKKEVEYLSAVPANIMQHELAPTCTTKLPLFQKWLESFESASANDAASVTSKLGQFQDDSLKFRTSIDELTVTHSQNPDKATQMCQHLLQQTTASFTLLHELEHVARSRNTSCAAHEREAENFGDFGDMQNFHLDFVTACQGRGMEVLSSCKNRFTLQVEKFKEFNLIFLH